MQKRLNTLTYQHPSIAWIVLILLVAIVAYLTPWMVNTATRSTLGAYDLAEWASLHPDSALTIPLMLASLLLRIQLVLMVGILVFAVEFQRFTARWWLVAISVVLFVAAQLPPIEFFTNEMNNPNYQQQFMLSVASLVVGSIGLFNAFNRYRGIVVLVFCAVGTLTTIWSLSLTREMMHPYGLPGNIGIGGIALFAVYILVVLSIIRGIKQIG